MPEFALDQLPYPGPIGGIINSMSVCAGSWGAAPAGYDAITSGNFPVANKAFFVNFTLPCPMTVYGLGWYNGDVVSGNVDVGIYDDQGNRVVSTGSTAQATAGDVQSVDVTDTLLGVGNYYLAIAASTTSATLFRVAMAQIAQEALGGREMTSAFPLPSTATFATPSSTGFFPVVMAFTETTF